MDCDDKENIPPTWKQLVRQARESHDLDEKSRMGECALSGEDFYYKEFDLRDHILIDECEWNLRRKAAIKSVKERHKKQRLFDNIKAQLARSSRR